jgi:hypothetical protein
MFKKTPKKGDKFVTRNGTTVEVICVDHGLEYPIITKYSRKDTYGPMYYKLSGEASQKNWDVIIPQRKGFKECLKQMITSLIS